MAKLIKTNLKIKFFHEVFDNLLEGCQVITPEWKYYYVNKEVIAQSNKKKDELIGYTMMEVYPGIENTPMFELLRKCMAERTSGKMINEFEYGDGTKRWFELSIEAIPEGLLIMSIDITQHRKAEEHIKKLNRLYKVLSSINQSIIRIRDIELLLQKACRIAVDSGSFIIAWIGFTDQDRQFLTEYTYKGIKEKNREKITISLNDTNFSFNPAVRAVLTGEPQVFNDSANVKAEFILNVVGSNLENYSMAAFPLKVFDKTTGVLVLYADVKYFFDRQELALINEMAMDISFALEFSEIEKQRKIAEEKLNAEKEKLAVTLQSIADGVIATDTEGRIVLMNKVAEQLTGWDFGKCSRKHISEVFRIIDENSQENINRHLARVLNKGDAVNLTGQNCLVARFGKKLPVSVIFSPVKNSGGQILGCVVVFQDMTEINKMITQINKTQKLESIGILAGGIAHDFNNLLLGIFGYIELARVYCDNNQAAAELLDKAMNVFNRTIALTAQLMTFSKGERPSRKTASLKPLLQQSLNFALSGSNVSYDLKASEDLYLCDIDENQIGQVIDNIIINAKQSMSGGGNIVVRAVNVSSENYSNLLKDRNYIKISISDNGSGIAPEVLPNIFEPFYTTKGTGNGLGLATCNSIIEKHNGFIEVETVQRKGTTFHVFIPASVNTEVDAVFVTDLEHCGSGRVLVMDDNSAVAEVTADMLKSMGYTVTLANDGLEAMMHFIEAHKTGNPFISVFLDLTIPGGMGGLETITELRKLNGKVPVFAISGHTEAFEDLGRIGFTDSVRKPYLKKDLAILMNKYL